MRARAALPYDDRVRAHPPKAVFFDMDDTLLDTSGGMDEAWDVTLAAFAPALGFDAAAMRDAIRREATAFWRDEAEMTAWRTRLADARRHVIELALVSLGHDPRGAHDLSERYGHEVFERLRLFDDAIPTLEGLRAEGFRLAILTNGPADMQRAKVERFGLERYVDALVIEGVFGRGKPDREVFEHAMGATGVGSHEAWHVGDNLYADIGGARNAGIHAVWIHRDRLESPEGFVAVPDLVVAHLTDLVDALAPEAPGR